MMAKRAASQLTSAATLQKLEVRMAVRGRATHWTYSNARRCEDQLSANATKVAPKAKSGALK